MSVRKRTTERKGAARLAKGRHPNDVAVGSRLRAARLEHGWSLPEAAKRLGWSRLSVINHEQGDVPVSEEKLQRYAEVYGKPAAFLRYGMSGEEPAEGGDEGVGYIPRALPERVRVWIYEFLVELVKGGATDREVQQARGLLTNPPLTSYLQDGTPGVMQLTEDEMIQTLEQIGKHVIKRVLRKRGRRV